MLWDEGGGGRRLELGAQRTQVPDLRRQSVLASLDLSVDLLYQLRALELKSEKGEGAHFQAARDDRQAVMSVIAIPVTSTKALESNHG